MSFDVIKAKIKSKLEGIGSIQEVHDYPTLEFRGCPAAVVASTRMEAEFETTTENKRTYVFTIFVYQEIETQGLKKARLIIEKTCDNIIETFDEDPLLTGIGENLPAQETMIVCFPVVNEILQEEKYVRGELEIKVIISFSET